ncbi:MAG: PDZ domain-containing protein [Ruminococcaceae bacterium]|nr:PDZ domain-containing protein [Oscillospiraceae bacterium]
MNKKISVGLCISLVIIFVTLTFAVTMVASKQIFSGIMNNISQRSQAYQSVDEISQIVSNYFYGSVSDRNQLNGALSEGYVNGLGDPNSRYLDATEYASYTGMIEGGVTGAGIETAYNYQQAQLAVTYVYEGSPAEKSGVQAGDVITAINNTTVTMSNFAQLQNMLYGSLLSSVSVEYEREGETKVAEIMSGFSIPSVKTNIYGNVGYIKISGFYKNTASEFKAAIEKLTEDGAESIVFDVRDVSSGTIDYSAQVIDVIVPAISDNIAVAKDKDGNVYKNKIYTAENSNFSMPFAVLINGGTSGPAELFACDMRDIAQAHIIGTTTAGNGTMQELFALEDGGAVLLTVALVEPRGGAEAVYDKVGVAPTVEVTLNAVYNGGILTLEQDNQLSTALNMLAS